MTIIEYFLNDKSIGKTSVKEASNSKDRRDAAKEIGIYQYDRFILDNGRLDSKDLSKETLKCLSDF
jgi:hypothetical protein